MPGSMPGSMPCSIPGPEAMGNQPVQPVAAAPANPVIVKAKVVGIVGQPDFRPPAVSVVGGAVGSATPVISAAPRVGVAANGLPGCFANLAGVGAMSTLDKSQLAMSNTVNAFAAFDALKTG